MSQVSSALRLRVLLLRVTGGCLVNCWRCWWRSSWQQVRTSRHTVPLQLQLVPLIATLQPQLVLFLAKPVGMHASWDVQQPTAAAWVGCPCIKRPLGCCLSAVCMHAIEMEPSMDHTHTRGGPFRTVQCSNKCCAVSCCAVPCRAVLCVRSPVCAHCV